ncbi:cytochrome b5-like heme/steroid binding domain-containing protein [Lipomyces arxii]|uniref:cytochrome b5-like heme/steroid binding domain-containing protein n=1 Tax=Lipomyces arxii TaxID=56418 RepID=UPI0034CFFC46
MAALWRKVSRQPSSTSQDDIQAQFPAPDSIQRVGGRTPAAAPTTTAMAPPPPVAVDRTLAVVARTPAQSRPLPVFNFGSDSNGRLVPSGPRPNSLASAARARKKVALEPGFSQLDWATLRSSGKDLSGRTGPEMRIGSSELKKHNTKEDAWTVLGGKVYNITPYLRYHPGGIPQLMRCVGRDGTKLFMDTHSWVNYDRMLGNCLVGYYIGKDEV